MPIQTAAILSPGDMGHAIGEVLRRGGLRVVTCLEGRSERTRGLAADAGIEDLPDFDALVREADIVLSVVVPASASSLADQLAAALERTGAHPLVADCNAIAPSRALSIGRVLTEAGARFVDAGIIGPPPVWGATATRLYASGVHAPELALLADNGLDVRVMGSEIGLASGLKMCYAALTKGLAALATEQQVAAASLGLSDPLNRELAMSQPGLLAWLQGMVPTMPPKAHRWVREMEEIAATFGATGLPPGMMLGAAELYGCVAASSLGKEIPENRTRGQSVAEVARILADELAAR